MPSRVELGGRVLECLSAPGHHEAAVTFYDPYTGFLLTGDTVSPGRLHVGDWPAFTPQHREVDRVLRNPSRRLRSRLSHRDDPAAGRRLPDPDHLPARRTPVADDRRPLRDVRAAIDPIGERPGRHAFADFVICRSRD